MKNVIKTAAGIVAVAGIATVGEAKVAEADTVITNQKNVTNTQISNQVKTSANVVTTESPVTKAQDKVSNAKTIQAGARADVDQAQKDVNEAKGQTDAAQNAVNGSQKSVKDAQAKVEDANASLKSAQDGVKAAQGEVDVAKQNTADSTSENIDKLKNTIINTSQKITDDTKTVDQNKTAVSDAQKSQQSAKNGVDLAQKTAITDQEAVKTVQDNVNQQQKKVDADSISINKQNDVITKDKAKVTAAEKNVSDKQDNIAKINEAIIAKQVDKETIQTKLNDADNQNVKNQDAIAVAQKAQQAAQAAVNLTQTKINGDNASLNGINTITLPAGFSNASFDQWTNGKMTANQLADLLAKGANISTNVYKHNKLDQADTFTDTGHLSTAQQLEITKFTAMLINQIRTQMGNPQQVINQDAIDFATKVAQGYDADGWSIMEHHAHDVPVITKVAGSYGLNDADNYYENASAGYADYVTNMDQLKNAVYDSLFDMMFNDEGAGFGHTISISGEKYGEPYVKDYVGVAFDKQGQLHIESITDNENTIPSTSTFDRGNIIANPVVDAVALKKEIADLTTKLSTQKAILEQAKKAVVAAQNTTDTKSGLQKNLDAINADLTKLATQLANQKAQLTVAQQDLASAKSMLTNDTNKLASLKAKLATDQAAVEKAKLALAPVQEKAKDSQAIVNQKQRTLANATNAVKNAESKLETAANTLKTDEAKLAKLNTKLYALQHAPEILAKKQAVLADAQTKENTAGVTVETADNALEVAQKILVQKKLILSAARENLNRLQKELDAKQSALENATDAVISAEQEVKKQQDVVNKINTEKDKNSYKAVKNGQTVLHLSSNDKIQNHAVIIPSLNGSNNEDNTESNTPTKFISNNAREDSVESSVNEVASQLSRKANKHSVNVLPQTDEKTKISASLFGLILLGLASAISVMGLDRKREN